jgi:hypothetical protein
MPDIKILTLAVANFEKIIMATSRSGCSLWWFIFIQIIYCLTSTDDSFVKDLLFFEGMQIANNLSEHNGYRE